MYRTLLSFVIEIVLIIHARFIFHLFIHLYLFI